VVEVDAFNIRMAALLAMRRSLEAPGSNPGPCPRGRDEI
jgi:hypothetical protein